MSGRSRDLSQKQRTAAIDLASGELLRRKLDPEQYRIRVERQNDLIYVVFTDRDEPEGARGTAGERPGIEVEIAVKGLRVVRWYFVR